MGKRPKIPRPAIQEVLHSSEYRCCICRKTKGLQIHHIDGDSSNNNVSNLAPLCHDHHDMAHTKRGLTRSLTPQNILHEKTQWESEVEKSRSSGLALHDPSSLSLRCWSYHNLRVFDLLEQSGINPTSSRHFDDLHRLGVLNESGFPIFPTDQPPTSSMLYSNLHASSAMALNLYLANLTDELIRVTKPNVINLGWPRRAVKELFRTGHLVYLGRRFSFRTIETHDNYEVRLMHTSANGFRIQAQFDTQTIFSSSALNSHYRGNSVVAGLFYVRSFDPDPTDQKKTLVKLTPMALGTGFMTLSGHKPLVAIEREDAEENESWDEF